MKKVDDELKAKSCMNFSFTSLFFLLPDHLAELPVVEFVVSARVELGESHLHLVCTKVTADTHKLLPQKRL